MVGIITAIYFDEDQTGARMACLKGFLSNIQYMKCSYTKQTCLLDRQASKQTKQMMILN